MRENILDRLRIDPGQLTLGQLLQERAAARIEIEKLRQDLETLKSKISARVPAEPVSSGQKGQHVYLGNVLISIGDLCKQIGVSRGTIYRWVNEGAFPAAVRISPGAVRWRSEDVEQWRNSLPTSS
ncbi:AlpA family phage regulatory protein [Wenzhouxiangella sp. XN24]|uniref:helix-turn-helix transcriptional regulator n=1 Tax=Wenzhouxiangella sp. XN24 TaxID=2713569 RepID=UPI0013ED49F6|nr:AlpA family phage regulatory protein [Wenzhouxiangella sp. XN24]NGX16154.1 AlpA family phage regulatory protein [Wenzhouxiangella sp. XN24]